MTRQPPHTQAEAPTRTRSWSAGDIPDQSGRVFVVTGAGSGLGLETATALARGGGHVILAVRDEEKGQRAAAAITGSTEVRRLDLADLRSVRAFAGSVCADHPRLDVLVNNAGVMATPRSLSAQGHELQFATNHLGHFALTGLLLDALSAGRDPRVVTVSSINHRRGRLHTQDIDGAHHYAPMAFYNQSKFANAVFGYELHRRLTLAGSPVRSVLAHPGYCATGLQSNGTTRLWRLLLAGIGNPLLAQSAARGALPQLYAATQPGVSGGEFIGPGGAGELRGAPARVRLSRAAQDPQTGHLLWELSQRMTDVRYPFAAA